MNLSLNIITKHDEPYLSECLNSVKELDLEYVIGFNGNKNSKEYDICKKFAPNTTYDIEWKDDFSYARNLLIEKTKTNWILMLDSDEIIEQNSIEKIKKLIGSSLKNKYHQFKVSHGMMNIGQIRLFYNDPNIRFSFPVHERIIPDVYPENHYDIEITHLMHDPKDSSDRNIKILLDNQEKDPGNSHYNFYLAIEYHLIGQQMKSLIQAEKFLHNYPIKQVDIRKMYMRYLIAWIYTFYFKNYQKALEILLAQLVLNCNISEFWCLLGDIYFKLNKYRESERMYKNAITMGEFKYNNMWLIDTSKYLVYPEQKIQLCKKYLEVDLNKFNLEISQPIIP